MWKWSHLSPTNLGRTRCYWSPLCQLWLSQSSWQQPAHTRQPTICQIQCHWSSCSLHGYMDLYNNRQFVTIYPYFLYFFLNSHIFTFSHLVTCCGSIQLSTTNADFLSVGVYANYIKGTWTPNGTIFNDRYFLLLLALIKAGLLIQSHMDFLFICICFNFLSSTYYSTA